MRPTVKRVVFVAALAGTPAVGAQAVADGGRLQLIQQGIVARDAGNHARAIELFTSAGRIEMRPGLRMSLAQEYAALGQHREACETATLGVDEARADLSRPENGRSLEGSAQVAAAECVHVGLLRVRLPDPPVAGVHLVVQGRAVEATGNVTTVAVDPGVARVEASAADGRSFHEEFTVRAGEAREMPVVFQRATVASAQPVAPVRSVPPVQTAPQVQTVAILPATGTPPVESRGAGIGPWILAGGGALALGAAAVFYGVMRAGALNDRAAACHSSTMSCDSAANDAQSRAVTATLLTNVSLGVGAAAIVGGALWYVLGRGSDTRPERSAWTWDVGPIAGGAALQVAGTL